METDSMTKLVRIIYRKVFEYFGDRCRTVSWMRSHNPMLGGCTPYEMLRSGRFSKLKSFVDTQLSDKPIG